LVNVRGDKRQAGGRVKQSNLVDVDVDFPCLSLVCGSGQNVWKERKTRFHEQSAWRFPDGATQFPRLIRWTRQRLTIGPRRRKG